MPHRYLADQTIFLMFFDKSTRTRNSFEAGMTQLGGHAHFLTADVMQVSHGESPKDTGIILSSYGHGIAIRHDLVPGEGNAYMREVAKWADAPVINMQCDVDHPCQTLADLMTIREKRGRDLRGLKIAVSWAYAPSYAKPLSVPQGLIMLMPRFGMDVDAGASAGIRPDARDPAAPPATTPRRGGGKFRVVDNMDEAFRDADIVIPKSWGCLDTMGSQSRGIAPHRQAIHELDLQCRADDARQARRALHASAAGRSRQRGDRRSDRRPAVGGLCRSRKPPAHGQSHHGADHGRSRYRIRCLTLACRRPWSSRWAATPSRGPGEPGTIPQQFEHTAETLGAPASRSSTAIAGIVITHGNGPQIGNILIRVEEGERRVPRLPLDTCVSDSQGGMGYMIQRLACECSAAKASAAASPP